MGQCGGGEDQEHRRRYNRLQEHSHGSITSSFIISWICLVLNLFNAVVFCFFSMKAFTFLTVHITSYVGDTAAAKSCVSLMPYTLVTPHYPPICRPVLLLPTVLGRTLNKKLAGWQGFQLCEPGKRCCAFSFYICSYLICRWRQIFWYSGGTQFPVLTDKSVWIDRSHCLSVACKQGWE